MAEFKDQDIIGLYQSNLGRTPDQEETDYWKNSATQGNWGVEDLVSTIKKAAVPEQVINRSYGSILNRTPENWEKQYWVDSAKTNNMAPGVLRNTIEQAAQDELSKRNTSLLGSQANFAVPDLKPVNEYVSPQSLVQNQLDTILKKGSPLMSLAESRSNERANQMGLLSSSMAVGAGQKALYDTALQIATPDANKYGAADLSQQGAYQNERLTAQQGNISSALQAQQDAAALQRQSQAEAASVYLSQQEINAAADRIGITAKWDMSSKSQQMTSDALTNFTNKVAEIQSIPDSQMDASAKAVAINDLTDSTRNIFTAAKTYDIMGQVVTSWEPTPGSLLTMNQIKPLEQTTGGLANEIGVRPLDATTDPEYKAYVKAKKIMPLEYDTWKMRRDASIDQ